jgi:hypothetical protein
MLRGRDVLSGIPEVRFPLAETQVDTEVSKKYTAPTIIGIFIVVRTSDLILMFRGVRGVEKK